MAMANEGSGKIGTETPSATPAPRPKVHRIRPVTRLGKISVKRKNEQSSIAFPYMDLDTAVSVAQAILAAGGVPVSRDQLAGVMGTTSGSGTFLMKVAAARMFGLIAYNQGRYELTLSGFSILDSDDGRQKTARAEAFLNVPLYRRVYDEFKGKQLPPRPHGLEQTFAKFGVSSKQTRSARLAFDKSASQAGFFSAGSERLIEPIIGASGTISGVAALGGAGTMTASASVVPPSSKFFGGEIKQTENRLDLDPLIQGLLGRLPKTGDKWEMDKRVRWLQTLAANLDMVYSSDEDDKIIIIECKSPKSP